MAKGGKQPGAGRPKGAVSKSTALAREAIAAFVDNNADRLNGWLDEIAAENGAKDAFSAFTSLLEYHIPKLARTDNTHSNPDGTPIFNKVIVEHVHTTASDTSEDR